MAVGGEVVWGTGLVSEARGELLPPPHAATRSRTHKRTPRAETLGVLFVVCMPMMGMTEGCDN